MLSLGRPSPAERRDRAAFDIRRQNIYIRGDVEVVVTSTVKAQRFVTGGVLTDLDEVRQILRAAVNEGVIDSFDAIKSMTIARPYVDGIDSIYVAIRPVADQRLMLA